MVSLYFKNKQTSTLMPEARLIDARLLAKEPYLTLINMLMETPKNQNLETAIPKDTKINKIELKGDIVYIDFSSEFVENHIGGLEQEENTIYSIVNTLTELIEVNGVKILIEGEENKAFKDEVIDFEQIFSRIE